jgi:hypothetical protein
MMSWSPTARRRALSGLASLLRHKEWRSSGRVEDIKARLLGVLADPDTVVRFTTARVASLLGDDEVASLDLIGGRLLVERHPEVAAALMAQLSCFRESQPENVDRVIAATVGEEPWRTALERESGNGRDECVEAISGLVLYLALRWRTPTAVRMAEDWFRDLTASQAAGRAIYAVRAWLKLGSERADERSRAFALLRLGASSLEHSRVASQDDKDPARKVHQCADVMIAELYFACGARVVDEEPVREPDHGFAREAFDVLELLTGFRNPSTVHHAIQTLAHLAPIDPARTLLLVDAFVKSGDSYTYDSVAADEVIRLIERYLAEFREYLAARPELLAAIRSLLNAFVRVGWPAGVALTYRLGDAFR